jgi:hypothetical protein
MALTLSNSSRNIMGDSFVDRIDEGESEGTLKLYTAGGSGGGDLLVTLTYSDPAFGDCG